MAQYLKPDSELGYIEDNATIEYTKTNNLRHVILGCMLGDFDETGAYVVSPEIVKELVEMDKYVVEAYDNIEICKSVLKLDKQISFMVTFEGNRATLSLLEKLSYEANFAINSGTYSNINEYVLDVVETSGEIDRNVIYTRWHIGNYGGNIVDIFNCDEAVLEKYFGIVNRFKYLLHANKILLEKEEEIEEVEAEYTAEMLEVIKTYPKLHKQVVADVKQALNEKKEAVSVKKPNFSKTFNELLDNAIQKNISVLDDKEKEEFKKDSRNVTLNFNIKRNEVIESEHIDNTQTETTTLPRIVRLKAETSYLYKSVNELAQNMISANRNVDKTLKTPTFGPNKQKIVNYLTGIGVAEAAGINIAPAKTEAATTTQQVAPQSAPKAPVYQQKGDAKSAGGGGSVKGGGGNKAGKGGKAASAPQKQAPKGAAANDGKKPKTTEQSVPALTTSDLIVRRLTGAYNKKYPGSSNNATDSEAPKTDRRVKRTHEVTVAREKTAVEQKTRATIDKAGRTNIGEGRINVELAGRNVNIDNNPLEI